MILKGYSAISFLLGKSGVYNFNSVQYFCQFTLLGFYIIPDTFRCLPDGFPYLHGGELTPRSHPIKFLKIWHFPRWVKQTPRGYWDRVFSSLKIHLSQKLGDFHTKVCEDIPWSPIRFEGKNLFIEHFFVLLF